MEETCLFLFKSEERTTKKVVLARFPTNYYLRNNTYTLEFLKIAFPSIGSSNLQI